MNKQMKQTGQKVRMAMISTFLLAFVCLFIAPAQAACVNPAGVEGEKIYNNAEKMMQFCNGTNWVAMACKNTNNIAPSPCNVPWGGTIPHASDVTAYQTASVPFGNTCTSETRSCNNNVLSGSYTFETCTIDPAANCTAPWGGTVNHGSNITAYQTATVPFGNTCTSETRSCSNGALSGSYANQTCTMTGCTYSWVTGSWGSCSASCGGGTRTRSVTCRRSDGTTVSDSFCTTTKPATSQSCNTQACCSPSSYYEYSTDGPYSHYCSNSTWGQVRYLQRRLVTNTCPSGTSYGSWQIYGSEYNCGSGWGPNL